MFSKYEVYSPAQSMYCYRDTNVLKNKFNISDFDELKSIEEEIVSDFIGTCNRCVMAVLLQGNTDG